MKLSYYRNKADRALQTYITTKYPRCELCGRPVSCGHHFFPKSSSSALRYELDNIVPVCVYCHFKFHNKNAPEIVGQLILKRGRKWFEDLAKRKHEIIKVSIGYYKKIIEELKAKLSE